MSVQAVVQLIRKLHRDTIFIIDDYNCYYVYGNDCYILYYLCQLSILGKKNKFIRNDITYLNYVISRLKEEHVDYMVLLKRHGYCVDGSNHFLDNKYQKYYSKGKIRYERIQNIQYIIRKLRSNILKYELAIQRIKELIENNDL